VEGRHTAFERGRQGGTLSRGVSVSRQGELKILLVIVIAETWSRVVYLSKVPRHSMRGYNATFGRASSGRHIRVM
jgi:hypothetical protein